jgi:hypothetical protein
MTTDELTIEERIRLVVPEVRDTVFFIPHPRAITEKILDRYSIPRTREYLKYLIYTTQGVLNRMDVVEDYLKDCIKGFEGAYTPFKESVTFNYGFSLDP